MAVQPDETRPTISTHVLDTDRGMPAVGIRVALLRLDVGDAPIRMTQALTDGDGRVRDLLERPLAAGDYRIEFDGTSLRGRTISLTHSVETIRPAKSARQRALTSATVV